MEKEIAHHIDSIMLEAAGSKNSVSQKPQFRCSSLPFCPLLNLLKDTREESFQMDFYTSIGTAVHETHQKWIPRTRFKGRVYGHWACRSCGQVHEGPKGAPIVMPADCKDCGPNVTFTYVEITVAYKGLEGHIDLITEISKGKFVIWDWKTTDLGGKKRRYPGTWRNMYPSSKNYEVQIKTYSALLKTLYNIDIIAWCLIFVDRGKVIKNKNDYFKVLEPWNSKKTAKQMIEINSACKNNHTLNRLQEAIAKAEGFSKRADKLLRHAVHNRPCTSKKTYNSYMDKAFWGDQACRFKDSCCKSDKASYDIILEALNPNDEAPF